MRVLDGAMLETDADTVQLRIDEEPILVAAADGRIVGALVATPGRVDPDIDGAHVEAIAVRQWRRARGIGTRLVEAAAERWTPLTAEFDADVRPFYEELGSTAGKRTTVRTSGSGACGRTRRSRRERPQLR